jgi:hypothetical protein
VLASVLNGLSSAWPKVEKTTTPSSARVGDEVPNDARGSLVSLHGVKEWLSRVVDGGDHTREEHSTSATKRDGAKQKFQGGPCTTLATL